MNFHQSTFRFTTYNAAVLIHFVECRWRKPKTKMSHEKMKTF
eukprot:12228.XXX_20365_20490_1 [CDS] Oithona nana genome sequencing.